jgi:DNA-binding HxlR family transcriptional regulator
MSDAMRFRERALQSNDAIELLANKWRITILHILREGPLRTREIQTAIPEVSPKMMTQALRGMERDGLLVREVHTTGTRHVEYRLTPMGTSLIPPLQELCRWAKANVRRRDQARERFDHLQNMKSPPKFQGS